MRVLVLEDDAETLQSLTTGLRLAGHTVHPAPDVPAALSLLGETDLDAAVLDLVVPGGSGFEVLEAIRRSAPAVRVLLLTARGEAADRVAGLDRGADDYLVKPFSFAELVARLRALERRGSGDATLLVRREVCVDLLTRVASARGRRLDLTPLELSLLSALVRAQGEPLDRSTLLRAIWGYDFDPGTNVVEVHINRLRRKLEGAGLASALRTLRGRGYVLD